MAKLNIKTNLDRVIVCGEFCQWDMEKAVEASKSGSAKTISIPDFPEGEYRVFCVRAFNGGEIYPTDKRQMSNRYFNGKESETIFCYF